MPVIDHRDLQRAQAYDIRIRWMELAPAGASDLIGLVGPDGRSLHVEVKSATGSMRPEQNAWAAMVRKFGGIHVTARSVEDVLAVLP